MTPEDRVSHTMELQEDVASKVQTIKQKIEFEKELLPQGLMIIWSMVIKEFQRAILWKDRQHLIL